MKKHLRLGTRSSPLALRQAAEVRQKLLTAHPRLEEETEFEIVPIRTTGDWKPEHKESRFIELGGNKGLFTKEIEEALRDGHIDMAIHSMKDVAAHLPDGIEIGAILDRLDPRDAFISSKATTLTDLPKGASLGTSSLRRQAQILAYRPDLQVVPLRGNVDTRLRKLTEGKADATLLAVAGLMRLDLIDHISSILDTDLMLPSAAQGAIGIEIRRDDDRSRALLAPIHAAPSAVCVNAERALLRALNGSCQTPVGALAKLEDEDTMFLEGLCAMPDGKGLVRLNQRGSQKDAEMMGADMGLRLKAAMPAGFFLA